MGRHFIEALDRRAMLSVALNGASLQVTGTESADDIAVMADARFINVLDVTVNGATNYYSLTSFAQISIDAGGGDDRITIDPALDVMAYPTSILGGDGNDRITAGAGNDTIDAGTGNDKIYANGGNDSVICGSGNDTIYGGAGNDTLCGGMGNDRIIGEAGNDLCDAGQGNNYIDAGDGDDILKSNGGSVTAFAGDGNDSGNIKSAGIVYAQGGNDVFVSTGGALLYGGDGNDNLQGTSVWGDAGDDTLTGLNGADEIHGGDGNDLIRGMDGNDVLFGDAGDDAILGGGGTDSLDGGDGNDNLYGTDGAKDKHKDLDGTDDAFGGAGSDWFEPNYPWHKGDYRKGEDRPVKSANNLAQDPNVGLYTGGTLTIGSNFGGGSYTSGDFNYDGFINSDDYFLIDRNFNPSQPSLPYVIETDPLGKIGWISNGVPTKHVGYTPPSLTHTQRLALRSGILQLPSAWQIGAVTSAGDGVMWYALTNAARPDTSDTGTTISGYSYEWRFVAVKKGTVLLSDAGHDVSAATPLGIDTAVLPMTASANLQLAGDTTVHHPAATFDSLPSGGPANTRGILLSDGVIWLPVDGSGAYFASGG